MQTRFGVFQGAAEGLCISSQTLSKYVLLYRYYFLLKSGVCWSTSSNLWILINMTWIFVLDTNEGDNNQNSECCKVLKISSNIGEPTYLYQNKVLGWYSQINGNESSNITTFRKIKSEESEEEYIMFGSYETGWKVCKYILNSQINVFWGQEP